MKNGGHVMRVRAASLWPLVEAMPLRMRVMGSNTDEEIELPPRNTKRWTIARKTAVVTAVRQGVLRLDEACRRYMLSIWGVHRME